MVSLHRLFLNSSQTGKMRQSSGKGYKINPFTDIVIHGTVILIQEIRERNDTIAHDEVWKRG